MDECRLSGLGLLPLTVKSISILQETSLFLILAAQSNFYLNNEMFDLKDIYWEVRPVFLVSKFVGLSPYTKRFKLSPFFVAVTIVYLLWTFLDSAVIMIAINDVNGTFQMSQYSLYLERFQLLMVGSTMIVSMILSIANAKPLSR